MLTLDHLTVIAPTLAEGAAHVRACLDLDVPFGTRHPYMGTHNHRLLLGPALYLEVIALDPEGAAPARPRWFGLDDQAGVRAAWEAGRRLRGWVASTTDMGALLARHGATLGEEVPLPPEAPSFAFAIPADGSLPLNGAAPSVIDHRGDTSHFAVIPDLGARLASLTLEHPDPAGVERLWRDLAVDRPPGVVRAAAPRWRALIDTPAGLRELT